MAASHKDRVEFITLFRDEYPERSREDCIKAAGKLLRLAATHGRLAVDECNGPAWTPARTADESLWRWTWDTWLARRTRDTEQKITRLCAEWGLPVLLGGDPRGYTVKVKFSSGLYNTLGGKSEGYGVPQ